MSNSVPFILWFTGLSGSGKSTLSQAVSDELDSLGIKFEHLDGDVVRKMFPKTGFSKKDRVEHNRRAGYLAGILAKHGNSVICSFISPYEEARAFVRDHLNNFIEIYVSTPIEKCEERDPKGLYKKVRQGEIKQFTGIDDPYEEPKNPEIKIDASGKNVQECINEILDYLKENGYLT